MLPLMITKSQKKRGRKEQRSCKIEDNQQKGSNKSSPINSSLSIKRLKFLIKRHRLNEWIKNNLDNLPCLNHEKIGNVSKSTMNKEIESVTNNLSRMRTPGPGGHTGKFSQTFKELMPILFKLF
jgi:hypothetical protein